MIRFVLFVSLFAGCKLDHGMPVLGDHTSCLATGDGRWNCENTAGRWRCGRIVEGCLWVGPLPDDHPLRRGVQ